MSSAYDGCRLVVATSTPTDSSVADTLQFCTKISIELVVATSGQITRAIDRYYHQPRSEAEALLTGMKAEAESIVVEEEIEDSQIVEPDSVVNALVNRILIDAYRRGVSDIHFEPGEGRNPALVRYRIDGECELAHRIATTFTNAIIARIKIVLLGIMAQRLARTLCENCKKARRPERWEYDEITADLAHICGSTPDLFPSFQEATFMERTGCEKCGGSGYRGRVAIHELMLGTPGIKRAIRERLGVDELNQIALEEGMWTLRMDGMMKVFQGLTDLDQIRKVCV